jgi:hypothetical protein
MLLFCGVVCAGGWRDLAAFSKSVVDVGHGHFLITSKWARPSFRENRYFKTKATFDAEPLNSLSLGDRIY